MPVTSEASTPARDPDALVDTPRVGRIPGRLSALAWGRPSLAHWLLAAACVTTVSLSGCGENRRPAEVAVKGSLADMAEAAGYTISKAGHFSQRAGGATARKLVLSREAGKPGGISIAEAVVTKAANGRERFVLRGVAPLTSPPSPAPVDVVAETDAGAVLVSLMVSSAPLAKGADFRLSARTLAWSSGIPSSTDIDLAMHAGGDTPMTGSSGMLRVRAGYSPETRRLSFVGLKADSASGERASGDVVLEGVAPADLADLARSALSGPGAVGAAIMGLKASRVDLVADRIGRSATSPTSAMAAQEARNGLLTWLMRGQATRRRAEAANAVMGFFSEGKPLRIQLSQGTPLPLADPAGMLSGGRLTFGAAPPPGPRDAAAR